MCVCLYLHASSVCACVCGRCVYMYVCRVCMCACVIVIVCMCVWVWYVCTNTRSKEVMNTPQVKSCGCCSPCSTMWACHHTGLVYFLNPQSFPWTSHCPLTLCKRDPCEWKKRVITHAQMYTHIHVYTLYTNTCIHTTQCTYTHTNTATHKHRTHHTHHTHTPHTHTHHTHTYTQTRMHKPLLALSSIDSSSLLFSVQLVVQLTALLV